MASIADLLKLLQTAFQDVRNIRYCALAATSIGVYDYIVTFGQEVDLVWKSRWSIGKVLFFIMRYYTLTFDLIYYNYAIFSPNLTDKFCLHWWRWGGGSGLLTFALAQLILQLRLYALYNRSKKILALMLGTFIAALAASSTLLGLSFVGSNSVPSHMIPGLPFCVPGGDLHLFYTFWIPLLISESLLCGLAVYRGIYLHRLHGSTFRSGNRLVEFLIRDSVVYFLVVFAIYFGNTFVFIFAAEPIWECTAIFTVALSYVLGNRLLLNVRSMLHSDDDTKPSAYVYQDPPSLPTPFMNSQTTATYSQPSSSRPTDTVLTEELRSEEYWKDRVLDIRNPERDFEAMSGYEVGVKF